MPQGNATFMKIIFSVLLFGLLFVNASAKTLVEQAYEA
ncbi:MAG: hypothetical protein ACI8P2_005072, partial [Candidatus Latescibacterota bacterium]